MFTSRIYNKRKHSFQNSKIWMFYFIFVANDLSGSHFHEKFIMGMLIGREHNKRDTYKTKEI